MRKFYYVDYKQMIAGSEALEKLCEEGIADRDSFSSLYDYNKGISIYPKRATKDSAGYDIFCPVTITLKPGQEAKIPTFIKIVLNHGEFLAIFPRSGLGFRHYCRLANSVGVVDSDYANSDNDGHIWVKIRNEGNKDMTIKAGEAMAQGIILPFLMVDGDSYDNGEIRNGGFGSTSK